VVQGKLTMLKEARLAIVANLGLHLLLPDILIAPHVLPELFQQLLRLLPVKLVVLEITLALLVHPLALYARRVKLQQLQVP